MNKYKLRFIKNHKIWIERFPNLNELLFFIQCIEYQGYDILWLETPDTRRL